MDDIMSAINQKPDGVAVVEGSKEFPHIKGTVFFYQKNGYVLVVAGFSGLPKGNEACERPIYGFHIHSGENCTGKAEDFFADSKGHYNPKDCPHPYHAGDMPPLFGCRGSAFSAFLTDRFKVKDIIGKTVIVHSKPDDFTTQPSGNAGEKIACGKIFE